MRIIIADDNEMLRRSVSEFVSAQANWEVCGEAKDGAEAIQKTRELMPDVILLDISMPGMSGFEAASVLRRDAPGVKILIMSQNDAALFLPGALEAGAHGCVDKSRLDTDLLPAIISVANPAEACRNGNGGGLD